MQGSWHAISWGVSLWLSGCSGLFCVGIFHTELRAELLAPVPSKSGYGMSWCAVLSVLSSGPSLLLPSQGEQVLG